MTKNNFLDFFDVFFNLIFPEKCVICNKIGNILCEHCFSKIKYFPQQKINPPQNIDLMIVCGYYDGILKTLIRKFKFSKKQSLAPYLVNFIKKCIDNKSYFSSVDLITSVPLHKNRLKERGFNQSELIAKQLSNFLNIPYDGNILERVKETSFMYNLSKSERKKNIKGAFSVNRNLNGLNILIVDDILTTGATFSEIASEIKQNGANSVYALAVAKSVI